MYLEPADVENTHVYDATGRLLDLVPDRDWVHVVPGETEAAHADELGAALRQNIRHALDRAGRFTPPLAVARGISADNVSAAALADLVTMAVQMEAQWRQRPTLFHRLRAFLRKLRRTA